MIKTSMRYTEVRVVCHGAVETSVLIQEGLFAMFCDQLELLTNGGIRKRYIRELPYQHCFTFLYDTADGPGRGTYS